jgi:hypothetical protein
VAGEVSTPQAPPAVRAKAAALRQRASTQQMWFGVDGDSMGRLIPRGSEVLVAPGRRPRPGEVWAFCRANGDLVVHRHRHGARGAHVFQGDAKAGPDDRVGDEQLIGRVVAVRRDGHVHELGTRDRIAGWSVKTVRILGARARGTLQRARRPRPDHGDSLGVAVGEVGRAPDAVGNQREDRLAGHDAGALVRDSFSVHPRMLTAARVLSGCSIDLVGLPTELAADDPRVAHALVSVLGAARPAATEPCLWIRAVAHAPATPSTPPETSMTEFEMWHPVPGELVLRHRSGLVARATSTAIDIGGDAAHFNANFRRTLLTALAHLLAPHDRPLVHAAAIASEGRVVLVLGGTGSGKSTVALCALRSGWAVLADDLVALRGSGSSIMLAGVPRPLAVPSDVLDADSFGDGLFDTQPLADDQRGRRELAAHVVTPGWFPLAGAIVVTHSDKSCGAVDPIDPHELLHVLLGSWAPVGDGVGVRAILPIAASIARNPASVVRLARDPARRVADAVSSLEEVRRRFGLLA